ncbi:MAG: bifunctional folylpolyglutamate synthase/dihydrofolate synthase [Spirochaetales bacterium]|nr:bifunctional folylpolyglutamate synthase/dihydrofolate synthase [Spirochaetales bacterium]
MKKSNELQFAKARDYIYSFINLEKDTSYFSSKLYKLDRMCFLLERFGNPQDTFKVIHLAGSKAKGSTAVFIASVLSAAGIRTGLYTSPHVSSILERIMVNQEHISPGLFISLVEVIKDFIEKTPLGHFPGARKPTFFELMTLMGWLAFKHEQCEYVVLETGLGGRLDATNLVKPLAVVLTPIELEHEAILGSTLEKIALEKCGIMKENTPVFCANQNAPVKEVIINEAARKNAELRFLNEELELLEVRQAIEKTDITFTLKGLSKKKFSLKLLGSFQAENAALAFLALHFLLPTIPDSAFKKGFAEAFLPGRMEVLHIKPLFIVDGAHTPASVKRALICFKKVAKNDGVLLFAAVKGKKIAEMAEILAPHFTTIIISTPGSFRKSEPKATYVVFRKYNRNVYLEKDPHSAFQKALELSQRKLPVFATGSLYFAAEIRKSARKLLI